VKLNPGLLSKEEGEELYALVQEGDAYLLDQRGPLTDEERAEIERLLGKAAGAEDYFQKRREREALEGELAERKEARRLMSVPKREQYAKPGSVTLPAYAFRWLRELPRQQIGQWTIADVGFLAVLLGMFANRQSLFRSGHFEEVDGEQVLIVSTGGRNAFRLRSEINPDREHLGIGPGRVHERDSLKTLARNGFFAVEDRSGEVRITLGEAGKELLREVDEPARATRTAS
jgi:hypothetical protein